MTYSVNMTFYNNFCIYLQATDDVVLMAQTLEKNFLQKIRDMPSEELEVQPPPRGKTKRPRGGGRTAAVITRNQGAQVRSCHLCNFFLCIQDEELKLVKILC